MSENINTGAGKPANDPAPSEIEKPKEPLLEALAERGTMSPRDGACMQLKDSVQAIKEMRIEMDVKIREMDQAQMHPMTAHLLSPGLALVYFSLAHHALQLGRMELGKVCEALDVPTPYPQSFNAESPVIEKPADAAPEQVSFNLPNTGMVGYIKESRVFTAEVQSRIVTLMQPSIPFIGDKKFTSSNGTPILWLFQGALQGVRHAQLWLGVALGELRKEDEAQRLGSSI